jgi:hypothetical protein
MKWERLAQVRTVVLIVVGLGALVLAAWLWQMVAGIAALGAACLLLEFLTGDRGEVQARDAGGPARY